MNVARLFWNTALYLSLATVLAEAASLTTLAVRGGLTQEKLLYLCAIAQNMDLAAAWRDVEKSVKPADPEEVSFNEVLEERARLSADLDLRELAAEKGLGGVQQLDLVLEQQRQHYAQLKAFFDQRLQQLRQGAADPALQEVQRQLESVPPKLAKDQILRILENQTIDPQISMHFVVSLFKGMPLDKRKKILNEFKNEETARLNEILREVRLGVPEVTLIRDTRDRLKELKSQS